MQSNNFVRFTATVPAVEMQVDIDLKELGFDSVHDWVKLSEDEKKAIIEAYQFKWIKPAKNVKVLGFSIKHGVKVETLYNGQKVN